MKKENWIQSDSFKPKIVISSYDSLDNPFYSGGGARAVHEVAKRLLSDFSTTVVAGRFPGCKDEEEIEGVTYVRIGSRTGNPQLSQIAFVVSLPVALLRFEFDAWLESFTPPISVSFLPLFTSKPVIGIAHSLPGLDLSRTYGPLSRLLERVGLKFYKRIITVSDFLKREILSANPKASVEIIPNGVEVQAAPGLPEGDYLLYLGRIDIGQKGLDLLLQGVSRVPNKGIRLMIAGGGTPGEERKLQALIKRHGMVDRVVLAGRVDGKRKSELLGKALAVVNPSRFESFSLTALEAMASGKPLVCFDIPGLAWIPERSALKVPPFDSYKLGEAIRLVAEDPGLRSLLSAEGRRVAESYNWGKTADAYKRYLRSLLPYPGIKLSREFSEAIEKIKKKKLPVYFISPHLDDAALSAGGLIAELSSATKVTVVSVFTSPGDDSRITLSARRHLSACGYGDSGALFRARRSEDRLASLSLGAESVHLGFVDALWRKKKANRFIAAAGKAFPSLVHLYPTYRWHVVSGRMHPEDSALAEKLKRTLIGMIPDEATVFCPAGYGGHVDHLLVREACEEAFSRLILWLDYPYLLNKARGWELPSGKSSAWSENASLKLRAVEGYKSQFKGLFPEGRVKLVPEIFYF